MFVYKKVEKKARPAAWLHLILYILCAFTLPDDIHAQSCPTDDSLFVRNARPVIFVVDKTYIRPEDRQWITDSLKEVLKALGDRGVILGRAAASPEGPRPNNTRLAHGRRKAADAILDSLGIDISRIHYDVVPEDYDLLCVLMQMQHDADYALVDSIVRAHRHNHAALKADLRRRQLGALWQRLLHDYFPRLRAVRLMPMDAAYLLEGHILSNPEPLPMPDGEETAPPAIVEAPAPTFSPLNTPESGMPVHRIPFMNVRTNLLYDLFYMPNYGFAPMWNIGLEFYPRRGHFTYCLWFLSPYYHRWSRNKFFQIRNYELETRYYFHGTRRAQYEGLYVSLAADANIYGIGFNKDKGWQGEGYGGQVTVGYVMPISRLRQWKLHLTAGAGFYVTRYDPYVYGTPNWHGRFEDGLYYYDTDLYSSTFRKRQHRYRWFGPTQLGISVSYDLLWRKGTRRDRTDGGGRSRGLSLKQWEKRM